MTYFEMNKQKLQLISELRDFCKQYDGTSCIDCSIFCSKEDNCPLHIIITRLEDSL